MAGSHPRHDSFSKHSTPLYKDMSTGLTNREPCSTMGVVTVYLDKISNLQDEDSLGKSDPYVVFCLEQKNFIFDTGYGKKISSKKKNDLNPDYGETFKFPKVPTLENLVLHVRVLDDDDFGFNDLLGSCHINLEKLKEDEPMQIEKVIEHKKIGGWFSKNAKIYLKVSYTLE
jgi:Ca2+-dependent lipid-binding protein